ncbi:MULTISPECIES: amphi-Trp domain-containing protein [unclassified Halorubrum]|uniref:amphi-Trp domain-containing protein n=1 Tax=unclassified Halorubrum TaxID=2642239 RepID=UPI000B98F687|nr:MULTISPECIES: amphi-Trp domain-containing protein [unclassified Halorubrum]OYR47288.1 amphi-Trp domain-containing protein [Halorubrum sp. Eb13]OYR55044.1 amphi-Trp domain-containing protein [Halorubrum sp. Ea1]
MTDDVEFPESEESGKRTVSDGFFEREVFLSAEETAAFLRSVADSLDEGHELTISGDDWEIPFAFAEPIEVEVEFSSRRERELELEVEFTERTEGGGIDVA